MDLIRLNKDPAIVTAAMPINPSISTFMYLFCVKLTIFSKNLSISGSPFFLDFTLSRLDGGFIINQGLVLRWDLLKKEAQCDPRRKKQADDAADIEDIRQTERNIPDFKGKRNDPAHSLVQQNRQHADQK